MAKRKPKKPKQNEEKRYWEKEREIFRRTNPKGFKEAVAHEKAAKILLTPLKLWRAAKEETAKAWMELENHLLSGKIDRRKLATLLEVALETSKMEAGLEQNFYQNRVKVFERLLKKTDFDGIARAILVEDRIAEVNSEKHFYGHMKQIVAAGVFEKFAELITRMRVSKDRRYASHRYMVAMMARNVKRKIALAKKASARRMQLLAEGEISQKTAIEGELLSQYMLVQQYFNLAEAEKKLYAYLQKVEKDKMLQAFLGCLKQHAATTAQKYSMQMTVIEREFREEV